MTAEFFVRVVGRDAVLIECPDPAGVRAMLAEVQRRGVEAVDVVPAAVTVLLDGVADPVTLAAELGAVLDSGRPAPVPDGEGPLVELPVRYDGPDLAEVARFWAVSADEVVERHQGTDFVVAFCGFAPGFAYLTGLPAELSVPRRQQARARVPAGSVGLAGEFTGIYPRSSPGGWQIIGHTDTELWRPHEAEPALLRPGTRVVFRDA